MLSQFVMKRMREQKMNKAAVIAIAGLAAAASADVLLNVDLSVVDQISITATSAASSGDITGSDSTGVLLADFFGGAGGNSIFTSGTGDLVANGDSSDGTPGLFNSSGNYGLNFWSWTSDDPSSFFTGTTAFVGSATWDIDSDDYADMLAGNASGDIIAFADTDDDGGVVIGQWNVVPAPGSMALLGLGGIVAGRRRR